MNAPETLTLQLVLKRGDAHLPAGPTERSRLEHRGIISVASACVTEREVHVHRFNSSENPLESDAPGVWNELIESIGPASLLVVIERRMGSNLRRRYTPEDVLQEAMLCAWRDRTQCEWRGIRAFRSWVISIIDHRIRDLADREHAQKRGGGAGDVAFNHHGTGSGEGCPIDGITTTPSKLAVYREQAAAMSEAIESLDEDVREVVRLRLFEQKSVGEIASGLGIGESAVRHRFRRGSEEYHKRLIASLAGSSTRDRLREVPGDRATGARSENPKDPA